MRHIVAPMFASVSIRWKLILIAMATSTLALVLACGAFLAYEIIMGPKEMAMRLETLVKVVGFNTTAAIAFNDPSSAEQTLSALKASPNIYTADIYTNDGKLFARYSRPGDYVYLPKKSNKEGYRFVGNHLELTRPIILDNEKIGMICVYSDVADMYSKLKGYLAIASVVLIAASVVAFILSSTLQRIISEPILHLSKTAMSISVHKDYSVRVSKRGEDEVGELIDSFNEMLEQIHERDETLNELARSLERRVVERTAQLEDTNRELEAFTYSVSHDLRAPLRSIDGFSLAIQEDYTDKLDDAGKDYIDRVRAATQRMAQLIDDLLRLSRITRVEMRRESVNLSEMAREIIDELKNSNPEREAEIVIQPDVMAEGDPDLLKIALGNVLGNAWKFTSKASIGRIELGTTDIDGEQAYFVRDNGIGFDMAYAGKLFTPFQRLHAETEYPGTGIGLAIVKRIIARHEGRIWAEGVVGQGATFYFTL